MRIPTTAEFFTFFAATGQLSGLSRMPGADSEFSLAPACDRSYKVKSGDICNSIAEQNGAPTYQIMCENDDINGGCTNLGVGEEICLGRPGEDCRETYVVTWPDNIQSIADRFAIPLRVFEYNNYCYDGEFGKICPPFNDGSVVCISRYIVQRRQKCDKIFARAS